jgi:hypothetical protein
MNSSALKITTVIRLAFCALVSCTLVSCALALAAAPAMASAETMLPAITVSGEATIETAPDLAEVQGGVTTEAKTAREAAEANARAMTAVIAALKTAGIAERDIRTARISIYPQSTPARNDPPRPSQIVGYRATNNVTVKVREIAKVANTLDVMVSSGANSLGGIHFIVSNPSKVLDEARAQAIGDARRKAEIYAKAAGATLGRPLAISEAGAAPPPIMYRAKAEMGPGSTPVAPGEQTLHVHVSVTYELKTPER